MQASEEPDQMKITHFLVAKMFVFYEEPEESYQLPKLSVASPLSFPHNLIFINYVSRFVLPEALSSHSL